MSHPKPPTPRPSFGWPLHFPTWIEENRHLLKPPVGNQVVYEDTEFIIMVVGGPNERTDYHVDPAEEFFYMLEGGMTLKCVDNKTLDADDKPLFVDVTIGEGEIFLLPAWVPHSPQREANTIGLVVERKRREDELDAMQWYCDSCHHLIHREEFHLNDITVDLPPVIERFFSSEENRTCSECGWKHAPKS